MCMFEGVLCFPVSVRNKVVRECKSSLLFVIKCGKETEIEEAGGEASSCSRTFHDTHTFHDFQDTHNFSRG